MLFKNKLNASLSAISVLIVIILASSCERNNTVTKIKDPDVIIFKGITQTDNNGWVMTNDATDWVISELWNEKENSLFPESNVSSCDTSNDSFTVYSYPNPCYGVFSLIITKPAESRFAFRIVDRNYNVLLSLDSVYSNGLSIDVRGFNIVNDTVRMYYKFFNPDCELKGHGDIKIIN